MVSDYHKITSPLKLVYYRGYITASYSYEGMTFRYPLFRVEESLFSKKMVALKESPEYEYDTVIKEIEDNASLLNNEYRIIIQNSGITPLNFLST